ncbi:MAG TPA: hybrid sensor histidine kinase/response regulator [Kofleriaceae bacterium]|nr:hybrid sensor histidine kinase/response regulator [Kofleriaceae bacterium]
MDDDAVWQRRIRELYANVEELYSHIDITIVVFDRDLVWVTAGGEQPVDEIQPALTEIARHMFETREPQRDIALDQVGRRRAHAFPLRANGSITHVVCVIEDDGARRELFVRCAIAIFDGYRKNEAALLDRERRARADAQLANQQRDQFLAVVAHELRSPMASILLWEQVLRNPEVSAERRTVALDAIHAAASGQAVLAADLLDVSRAINGKLHIERRPVALADVLAMAVENARPQAIARKLDLALDLDAELGSVLGDSRRLRQVFDNLIANALKFTDQGRVDLRARCRDGTITVDVSDTGRGVAPEFLPHLFEAFQQGHETGGLGLGLAIARQLVEIHGGTLTASSAGLGHGARFTVSLPQHSPAQTVASPPALPAIRGMRVLLVDDDARLLEALALLLGDKGAVVRTASSAAAALTIVEHEPIDVAVSDISMPGEDGHSFARKVRSSRGTRLPLIAISARIVERSREEALAAGFDRYVGKPLDLDLLVSTIAELVNARAA